MRDRTIRYIAGQKVRVIAQDDIYDDNCAQVGDIGIVIGHEDSEACVKVQFNNFTDWLWNTEVEVIE